MNQPDHEKIARAAGWSEFQDSADATLLIVAHEERDVHFGGPNRWHEAVEHEQSLTVKPTSALSLVYRNPKGELHYQPADDLQECGTPIDPETDEVMELIGWSTTMPAHLVEAPVSTLHDGAHGRHEPPIKLVCDTCGSDDIVRDATARWNVAAQDWALSDVMDDTTCEQCGAEVDVREEVLAEDERPLQWFAVTGRVPLEDEDSVYTYQAVNKDAAIAMFKGDMTQNVPPELIEETDRRHGTEGGVFVTSVLRSDSRISEI